MNYLNKIFGGSNGDHIQSGKESQLHSVIEFYKQENQQLKDKIADLEVEIKIYKVKESKTRYYFLSLFDMEK